MAGKKPKVDLSAGGFFSQLFNARNQALAGNATYVRMEQDMIRAFWAWEHDTIKVLAAKGAPYTHEMLEIAVYKHRDRGLVRDCLRAGVMPREKLIIDTIDRSDENLNLKPILGDLLEKAVITSKIAQRLGTVEESAFTQKAKTGFNALN